MIQTTDADGYVTEYSYNPLDLVTHINYNGGKEVSYAYNKAGELVSMADWNGTTTFEVDLLKRVTKTTDTKGTDTARNYEIKPDTIENSFYELKCESNQLERYTKGVWSNAPSGGENAKYIDNSKTRVTNLSFQRL